jgi:hypothetical protein
MQNTKINWYPIDKIDFESTPVFIGVFYLLSRRKLLPVAIRLSLPVANDFISWVYMSGLHTQNFFPEYFISLICG